MIGKDTYKSDALSCVWIQIEKKNLLWEDKESHEKTYHLKGTYKDGINHLIWTRRTSRCFINIFLFKQPIYWIDAIIPISQLKIKILKFSNVKLLAQGHLARKWESWEEYEFIYVEEWGTDSFKNCYSQARKNIIEYFLILIGEIICINSSSAIGCSWASFIC